MGDKSLVVFFSILMGAPARSVGFESRPWPQFKFMYARDTEILFPMRVAPNLRGLRGRLWRATVDQACASPDASPEQLAFSLAMIRLAGCLSCDPDSYRATRGCTNCAMTTVQRYHGDEKDLLALVEKAKGELRVTNG